MPLYEYKCKKCNNEFEKMVSLVEYDKKQDCQSCGSETKKLMSIGGTQDDHPVWLDESIIRQLQDTDDPSTRRISSRTEYNKYLKDTGTIPTN